MALEWWAGWFGTWRVNQKVSSSWVLGLKLSDCTNLGICHVSDLVFCLLTESRRHRVASLAFTINDVREIVFDQGHTDTARRSSMNPATAKNCGFCCTQPLHFCAVVKSLSFGKWTHSTRSSSVPLRPMRNSWIFQQEKWTRVSLDQSSVRLPQFGIYNPSWRGCFTVSVSLVACNRSRGSIRAKFKT